MVAGGIVFGAAVVRARVLPPWTGFALIAGVSLNLLVAVLPAPPIVQMVGSAVRNVAFIGMGVALLRPLPPSGRAA